MFSKKSAPSLVEIDADELLAKAKSGDMQARELLLQKFSPFVLKTCSQVTGRYINRQHDDEFSLALLAFNQAIDQFDPSKGSNFLGFAELLIRRRLVDYFRKESKNFKTTPFSSLGSDNLDEDYSALDVISKNEAIRQYDQEMEAKNRREEILLFTDTLEGFGITLEELVRISPKHQDARERAVSAAKIIVQDPVLKNHVLHKKELPLKLLGNRVNVSRKTLERQRKYILALVLVMAGEFPYLKDYISG